MFNKLDSVIARYNEVAERLSLQEVIADKEEFKKLSLEYASLASISEAYAKYKKIEKEERGNQELLREEGVDPELKELAEEELALLIKEKNKVVDELKLLLTPKDPKDAKNVLLEIRAGTGGEEASLFAADLFRMYLRYSEKRKWQVEVMSQTEADKGGLKEVIAEVRGTGAYSRLKYESGTHRVQRVPDTEASGRVHTSAATVAIMPEVEEVEVKIDPSEIRFDVFRASGHGGQSVNTTDSAVRLTHIPTGLVVSMQDEKSQHKNKEKALKILRSRLFEKYENDMNDDRARTRKKQVGSGDRSERIRTYNFPQGRMTDHRIGLTLYRLSEIVDGDLDEIIDKLTISSQAEDLSLDQAAGPGNDTPPPGTIVI
ncbi:MAG: peptide chain release factor 1 [Nitrospinota bacterium]